MSKRVSGGQRPGDQAGENTALLGSFPTLGGNTGKAGFQVGKGTAYGGNSFKQKR